MPRRTFDTRHPDTTHPVTTHPGTGQSTATDQIAWIPVLAGGRVLRCGDRLVVVEPGTVCALAVGDHTHAAQPRDAAGKLSARAVLSSAESVRARHPDVMPVALPHDLDALARSDRQTAMWAAAQWKWLADNATDWGSAVRGFTRIDPCVLVLVQSDDAVVLLRRHGAPHESWGAVAGFVEPGESAEDAVAREVAEETGLTVSSVRYVGSESWPPSGSLMFGFVATVTEPTGAPLTLDTTEHEAGMWFGRDEVARAHAAGRVTTDCGAELSLRAVRGLGAQILQTFLRDH